ncbi:MAG: hypothetical protein H6877_12465 [Rhodobiaceae bacterium]|nr:hypothetical protein [Rhodobiaceae bacterium]
MTNATESYQTTAEVRERTAKQLFDINRVKREISDRAAEGYRDLRLMQAHPYDLSRSPQAFELEAWLEANQYRYVWTPTPPLADPLRSTFSEDYPELVIFW